MEEMSELRLLTDVKRMDVPLHLKSRIDARISQMVSLEVFDRWLWLAAASVAVLIAVNSFIIRTEYAEIESNGQSMIVTTAMGIQTSNQLY